MSTHNIHVCFPAELHVNKIYFPVEKKTALSGAMHHDISFFFFSIKKYLL